MLNNNRTLQIPVRKWTGCFVLDPAGSGVDQEYRVRCHSGLLHGVHLERREGAGQECVPLRQKNRHFRLDPRHIFLTRQASKHQTIIILYNPLLLGASNLVRLAKILEKLCLSCQKSMESLGFLGNVAWIMPKRFQDLGKANKRPSIGFWH